MLNNIAYENENCRTQKREIEEIQNIKSSQNCEI